MEFKEFSEHLNACFKENSLDHLLDEDKVKELYDFANILAEKSKVMNLTAITDMHGVIFKHFCDCAPLCKYFEKNKTVIDVGCGAGFPSVPLAILRPDLQITSLDSTAKKIAFINESMNKVGVTNLKAVSARAEEYAADNRERFDYATSRAVARLNILCELCLPLVKVGGVFVPMKATQAEDELIEASRAIKALGGETLADDTYSLSYQGEVLERHVLTVNKRAKTPTQYPRKYAQILKKPL